MPYTRDNFDNKQSTIIDKLTIADVEDNKKERNEFDEWYIKIMAQIVNWIQDQ